MKKSFIPIILSLIFLLLSGCSNSINHIPLVKDGAYYAKDCKSGMLPVVSINNGSISFSDVLNSQALSGTNGSYSINNNVLTMKTKDSQRHYVFLIDGDKLIFQKKESSSPKIINEASGDNLEDHLIFYPQ